MLVVLVALAELAPQRDVPYVVFPVLLWAAVRFGPRGAATAVFVVCSITVWNTAQNDGPFLRDSITDSLLATQLFIAVSALTSLVLAAETAERARATSALAASEASQRALADEQAALRRVATLVASGLPPSRVFGQVTEEVARLLALPGANVMRYDGARTATVVGGWSEDGALTLPIGDTFDLDGDTVVARVLRSGEAQRVDRYQDTSGDLAETMQRSGYRAAVAAPVTVDGRLWGALAAGTRSEEPLPDGVEQRLCDFAELVAQALANADAREQLAASRARIVEAGDAERRRLERNLHDGAQQRLVALSVDLTLIGVKLETDPPAARKILTVAQEELGKGSTSCASWRGESTRLYSPTAAWAQLCKRWSNVRRSRWRSPSCPRSGCPARSKRPPTTSSPRRSPTWPSTRTPPTSPSVSAARTSAPRSRSPTMASAAQTPPTAPGCAGWRTASRPSTASSHLDSRPEHGTHISAEIPAPRTAQP